MNAPIFSLNPRGALSRVVTAGLPLLGVRRRYFDFDDLLAEACPQFDGIEWQKVQTRLLLGASEIINGVETVFDSDCNMEGQGGKHTEATVTHRWRRRLPLSLRGAAASGTLPAVREAEEVDGGYYWDGLYSQNPPVREFLAGVRKEATPDELWILRINPQQRAQQPQSNADIQDRENELMGNLSLNKELDFVLSLVFPDILIDALVTDKGDAILGQTPADLIGTPLLLRQFFFDQLHQIWRHFARLPSRPRELPSKPSEFHTELLTEPDLILSHLPARAIAGDPSPPLHC